MTVAELIEELKKQDPDALVVMPEFGEHDSDLYQTADDWFAFVTPSSIDSVKVRKGHHRQPELECDINAVELRW